MTVKKTTLSIAISLLLFGGASTVGYAQDIPPDFGSDPGFDAPPPDDGGDFPPPDDGGDFPPPDDGGDFPPPDDGGDFPPPDDGGDLPPPDDGGDFPPPDDGGDLPPPDDGGDLPPPDDGGDFPPPDDGGDLPPPADGGDFPPPDDGGDLPPPDDGGDLPPPDDGGDLPPPDDGGDLPPPDDGGDLPPPDGSDPSMGGGDMPPPDDEFFVDLDEDPFVDFFPEERLEDRGVAPEEIGGFDEVDPELYGFFDDEDLEQVPPAAYGSMDAEILGQFDEQALDGIEPEQFGQIPPAEIGKMPMNKVGEFSPDIYNEFTPDHLAGLKDRKEEFYEADPDDIGRMLTNLPPEIGLDEVRDLVPPTWELDDATGELTPPAGTRLVFNQQDLPDDFPPEIDLPAEIPDFGSEFGVGGRGQGSVLDEMNEILGEVDLGAEFLFEQPEDDFVLHVKGQGVAEGIDFAFKPDSRQVTQAGNNATPGLSEDSEGNYVLTTKGGKQMTVVPAPWDNKGLLEALQTDESDAETRSLRQDDSSTGVLRQTSSRIQYNEPGVVVVETKVRRQDGSGRFEEAADEGVELSTDTNEGCKTPVEGDVNNPPPPVRRQQSSIPLVFEPNVLRQDPSTRQDGVLRQPGVYLTRESSEGEVVYPDGRVQRVRAGISSPSRFMDAARRFTGVREIAKRADGTFTVKLDGDETSYKLEPTFDVKARCLLKGEKHEPKITPTEGGMVEFEVQEQGSSGTEEVRVLRMRIGAR